MENIVFSKVEDILAKSAIEFDRKMEQSRAEAEKRNAEFDRNLAKLTKSQAETDRFLNEKFAETDRLLNEKFSETDRIMKTLGVRLGGMANSHGSFAEEYFFNAFDDGKTDFFGEKFDEIEKNLKNKRNGLTDEYDVVMFNHTSVAIIEAKYKAHENDVPATLKKADTFRKLFPDYKDFKIYLGLASMSFYPELEEECKKQGIAIIKQVGDKVVIYDENLKTF
jgi:hypothetical protein